MEDLTGIGKVVDSKLAERAYEDVGSSAAKQIGRLAEDSLKAFRLFTAPIQLLASAQDRFERWLEQVRARVPEERQIEAAPEIAGPALLNLRFLDDNNPLSQLYLNLLQLAIDRDNCHKAHPAFLCVIEHLSPDDALLLHLLRHACPLQEHTTAEQRVAEKEHGDPLKRLLSRHVPRIRAWPLAKILTSLDLLSGLRLVESHSERRGAMEFASITLTLFGFYFVEACIGDDFDIESLTQDAESGKDGHR